MHASGVAHCDLKPDAFMRTNEDELVLVDFNLARGVDEVLDGDLPGSAGWVSTGTPAATGAMVDRVALASVTGWLLHVPGCREPDTTFEDGVVAISDACAIAEGPHLMLLQVAESLLSSNCTLSDTVALLTSPAVRVSERAKENALPTRSASKKPVDP
jgi:serine/threonine protein kinase